MAEDTPIACSLDASELTQRLAAIAEIGAQRGLISRDVEGDCQVLHFRASVATRKRLEEIVAAEAKCCSFLDLSLSEAEDELVLRIAAPQDARALAKELSAAFAGVHT